MTIKIIDWQNCHSFYPSIHSTASKFWSTVNWCQSLAFDHSYLSWNDHCDQWLFQEIIFLLILFFLLEILLNDLEIVFLELKHINTFTKQKEQIYFFLPVHFLLAVSYSFCVWMLSTYLYFSFVWKHRMSLFSFGLLVRSHSM